MPANKLYIFDDGSIAYAQNTPNLDSTVEISGAEVVDVREADFSPVDIEHVVKKSKEEIDKKRKAKSDIIKGNSSDG